MSRSNGRVLPTILLCVLFYLPCAGQTLDQTCGPDTPPVEDRSPILRTHDFSAAISAHVRSSKLPETQAKSNAIAQLFAQLPQDQTPVKRNEVSPGVFSVMAPASFHEHIVGLAEWMADGEKQITIKSRILTVTEEKLRKLHTQLNGNWEMTEGPVTPSQLESPNPLTPAVLGPNFAAFKTQQVRKLPLASSASNTQQFLPCRIASVRNQELNRIIAEAQSDTSTNVMQAPTITIFPGQNAVVSDVTQRPFVTSVKPNEDTENPEMQPVITVLEDGLSMNINAAVVGDEDIQLNSSVSFGEIGEVETFTFETPGKFSGTSVQIPEYTVRKVSISKKLLRDQSLIIDPHFVTEKVTKRRFRSDIITRKYTIVILTAQVIQQQPEQHSSKVAKL